MTRLSDADREALAQRLGTHYAVGRLNLDELHRRIALVFDAEDADAAAEAMADLPAWDTPAAATSAPPRRKRWSRRHGEADAAAATWRPTPERFRDPTTGRIMRVWVDPADGRRHYVSE